jgi:hypothetical protein
VDTVTQGTARRIALLLGVMIAELALVLSFLPPKTALAQVANGVYEGNHTGGGTIKVFVGADGRTVPKIEIYNIPSDVCTWSYFFLTATANPPVITNGEFSGQSESGSGASGRFVANNRVEGTFQVKGNTDSGQLCSSPTYSYSATLGGAPSPQPQPQPQPQPKPSTPPSPPSPATSGNFCRPGESPKFQFGLLALKGMLGDAMGDPIECEHPNSANGDTLQRTTKGLAYYRKATNTPTFTNGDEHWALRPEGLLYWVGPAVDPP